MKRWLLPVLVCWVLANPVNRLAASQDWDALLSMHTVRALVRIGDDLWGATNGGLFRFDLETETFQVFNTVDGLSSNDVRALVVDSLGNLILGMGNAYIDIFNLATHNVTSIPYFKQNSKIFKIYALYNHEGDIYVGTDIGVHCLLYYEDFGQYLVKNDYTSLGDFPAETGVSSILVHDGYLWVGTSQGVARGDLSALHLESPESWDNFTTEQGLSADSISALAVLNDTLHAAAPQASPYGLNIFTGDGFESLPVLYATGITFLKVYQDTLYLGRSNGIYRLDNGSTVRYGPPDSKGLCLEFAQDSTMWAGMEFRLKLGGLRKWLGEQWAYYAPEGPMVQTVTEILMEGDGSLWVTGRMEYGISNGSLCHFDGDHWVNLNRYLDDYANNSFVSPDSFFWFYTRGVVKDHTGSVWVASDGRGVGWFQFEDDTIEAQAYYSAPSGRLTNYWGSGHYCVVRDLLTDGWGNVWICNSEADPQKGLPLVVVPYSFIEDSVDYPYWAYLTIRDAEGNIIVTPENQVDRIAQDSFGRKWFGANNNKGAGIWVLDDNNTPYESGDDLGTQIYGLPSDSITAIACDRDGIVWVGTPAGVQYFYPEQNPELLYGFDLYQIPIGSYINTIAVDPQNNKWFGTNSGVCVLASDNYTWLDNYKFTTVDGDYPSPLPGNVVQAISFDPRAGYAYLGTDQGLVRLITPYKQMGPTVNYISIWPNPFLIREGDNSRLYFDAAGLSETAELKIFTLSGFLVRRLTRVESWDGRNARGELVGSGVYLLLAYSPDGNTAVGKVAVIQQ